MSVRLLLVLLIAFRLLNATLTQTYFQPDEFWQSLEVAHRIVFGYGYSTWEWRDGRATAAAAAATATGAVSWWDSVVVGSPVRSIAYPSLFVPLYWTLKVLKLDDTFLLAVFAGLGDWYAFRLGRKVTSERTAWIFLVLTCTSPYALHTATRTFSNSLEASLTSAALFHWPSSSASSRRQVNLGPSLFFIGLTFLIRPTSAILWIFLGVELLLRSSPSKAPRIITQCIFAVLASLVVQIGLDSWFYGRLTITPLSFLAVNVLGESPVSLFYGQSASHYYLTQGLPVVCTVLTPWVIVGWVLVSTLGLRGSVKIEIEELREPGTIRLFSWAAAWVTLCMSALGHKEWRFLQQLGPLWLLFAAVVLNQRRGEQERAELKRSNDRPPSTTSATTTRQTLSFQVRQAWRDLCVGGRRPRPQTIHQQPTTSTPSSTRPPTRTSALPPWALTLLNNLPPLPYLLLAQVPLTAYLLLAHGRGQMQVMRFLHAQGGGEEGVRSVGFLMPCHSTPWQAWMHLPHLEGGREGMGSENGSGNGERAWFLSCEPPLHNEDLKTYRDQTRVFFDDPFKYLSTRFPPAVDPHFPPSPSVPSPEQAGGAKNNDDNGWSHTWPSHLVLFETSLSHRRGGKEEGESVGDLLKGKGYGTVKRLWNGFGSDDENRWGDVLVLRWQGEGKP
ncbi:unnamed protein product [Tilletia controversa]|nr:unnamed protein product [Tilletia controversa]